MKHNKMSTFLNSSLTLLTSINEQGAGLGSLSIFPNPRVWAASVPLGLVQAADSLAAHRLTLATPLCSITRATRPGNLIGIVSLRRFSQQSSIPRPGNSPSANQSAQSKPVEKPDKYSTHAH